MTEVKSPSDDFINRVDGSSLFASRHVNSLSSTTIGRRKPVDSGEIFILSVKVEEVYGNIYHNSVFVSNEGRCKDLEG